MNSGSREIWGQRSKGPFNGVRQDLQQTDMIHFSSVAELQLLSFPAIREKPLPAAERSRLLTHIISQASSVCLCMWAWAVLNQQSGYSSPLFEYWCLFPGSFRSKWRPIVAWILLSHGLTLADKLKISRPQLLSWSRPGWIKGKQESSVRVETNASWCFFILLQ